jgi:hypothetical protein
MNKASEGINNLKDSESKGELENDNKKVNGTG